MIGLSKQDLNMDNINRHANDERVNLMRVPSLDKVIHTNDYC